MRGTHVKSIGTLLLGLLICVAFRATAQTRNVGPLKYTLTIYVDEGRGELNGHVFVELSDGKNNIYRGFYPEEARTDVLGKEVAPLGVGGGEIRDDVHHDWGVKRTYNITKDGFDSALRGIEQAKAHGAKWWLANHCGDFAEGVANAAGVPIHLPLTSAGRNRPAVFGEYLREHGGMVNNRRALSVDPIVGTWRGTVYQPAGGSRPSYRIQMQINSPSHGTTDYPELSCGGSLSGGPSGNGSYSYQESITYGRATAETGGCIDGRISIRLLDDGAMSWSWSGSWQGQNITVSGTLGREGTP